MEEGEWKEGVHSYMHTKAQHGLREQSQLSAWRTVGAQQTQIPSFCTLQGHLHSISATASTVPMETAPVSLLCPSPRWGSETDSRAQEWGGLRVDEAKNCISAVSLSPAPRGEWL